MIEIDFGENGGGQRSFRSPAEVMEYIALQADQWAKHRLAQGGPNRVIQGFAQQLAEPWRRLHAKLNTVLQQLPENTDRLAQTIAGAEFIRKAVSLDSELGRQISEIAEDLGPQAALGAVKYVEANSNDLIFANLPKSEAIGALSLFHRISGLSPKGVKAAREAARSSARSLQEAFAKHHQALEQIERDHAEQLKQITDSADVQKSDVSAWRDELARQIQAERDGWKASWADLYKVFTERLRLESAVKLWNDRSVVHRDAAHKWRLGSLCVAIGGLLLAFIAAAGFLELAQWLFADALVGADLPQPQGAIAEDSDPNPSSSELRPTWQFEIIFASAATLLYLTVYFWLLRIIVRLYMTEEHLAIDAKSRSAMAETYLALTKEEAATDQDRAIVLASLFRPIADGIVSDDGLPAITPAAILSGWAGGKS